MCFALILSWCNVKQRSSPQIYSHNQMKGRSRYFLSYCCLFLQQRTWMTWGERESMWRWGKPAPMWKMWVQLSSWALTMYIGLRLIYCFTFEYKVKTFQEKQMENMGSGRGFVYIRYDENLFFEYKTCMNWYTVFVLLILLFQEQQPLSLCNLLNPL